MTSLGSVDTPHIEGRYAVDSRYPRTQKPVTTRALGPAKDRFIVDYHTYTAGATPYLRLMQLALSRKRSTYEIAQGYSTKGPGTRII